MTTEQQVKMVMIAAAIVVAIGSVLPWVTATAAFGISANASGVDGGDGYVTIALAAIVALVALSPFTRWTIIPATLLAAAAGYEIVHVIQRVNDLNAEHDVAHFGVGFGLGITTIAAFAAFVAAAYAAIRVRKYERITRDGDAALEAKFAEQREAE